MLKVYPSRYFIGSPVYVTQQVSGFQGTPAYLGPPVQAPADSPVDLKTIMMWAGIALLAYFLFQAFKDISHA